MAEVAVSFLLKNMRLLMQVGTLDLISGLQSELDELQKKLRLLKRFLEESRDEESWEKMEPYVSEMRIREAIYKAEDAMDDYRSLAEKSSCFQRIKRTPKRLKLRRRLKHWREKQLRPLLDSIASVTSAQQPKATTQHQKVTNFSFQLSN